MILSWEVLISGLRFSKAGESTPFPSISAIFWIDIWHRCAWKQPKSCWNDISWVRLNIVPSCLQTHKKKVLILNLGKINKQENKNSEKGCSKLPPPSAHRNLQGSEACRGLTAQSRTPTSSCPALNASLLGVRRDFMTFLWGLLVYGNMSFLFTDR